MKSILIGFVTVAMMAVSCTKAQLISDLPEDINKGATETPLTPTTAKRGVGFNSSTPGGFGNVIAALKSNWYYDWGVTGPEVYGAPRGVEFVPMLWGKANVTDANLEQINKMYLEGKIAYVLGFNEPDLKEESNMSVAEALTLWAKICDKLHPGIKLVSPAPSYPTRQWLKDFMAGAAQQGLRVDYVAVHIYAGPGTAIYKSQIEEVYRLFGKKVWITEFAPRDESPNKTYTMEQALSFMQDLVPSYENMESVYRYAWFSGSATMAGLVASRLVNDNAELTMLGNEYIKYSPNNNVMPPVK